MSRFGSTAIDKNGLGRSVSPDFPLVHKLAIHTSAPQSRRKIDLHQYAWRLSISLAFKRGDVPFESNHVAWLYQAKNLSRRFLSRRYPAARDLCGNGLMHKTSGQNRRCL